MTRLLALGLAFVLGIGLAMPQLLPTIEYLRTSYRMTTRLRGENPTEILGGVAIAQALVPYSYGTDEITSWQLFDGNIPESGAPAYAGLFLVLTFGPLAFVKRRHRGLAIFMAVLAFLAAIAIVGIPVLREPFFRYPLSALRNNRFVFVSSFALLTLAVLGMDAVFQSGRRITRSRIMLVPLVLLAAAGGWCLLRVVVPPADLGAVLDQASKELAAGEAVGGAVFNSRFACAFAGVVRIGLLRGIRVRGCGRGGAAGAEAARLRCTRISRECDRGDRAGGVGVHGVGGACRSVIRRCITRLYALQRFCRRSRRGACWSGGVCRRI
jgi:hypothetical protein